jgi:hypothetical protein
MESFSFAAAAAADGGFGAPPPPHSSAAAAAAAAAAAGFGAPPPPRFRGVYHDVARNKFKATYHAFLGWFADAGDAARAVDAAHARAHAAAAGAAAACGAPPPPPLAPLNFDAGGAPRPRPEKWFTGAALRRARRPAAARGEGGGEGGGEAAAAAAPPPPAAAPRADLSARGRCGREHFEVYRAWLRQMRAQLLEAEPWRSLPLDTRSAVVRAELKRRWREARGP